MSSSRDHSRRPVPAVSSSPTPSGLGQPARTEAPQTLPDAVCLARFLVGLPDPRGRRGRPFPLVAIVSAATASVPAGARSLTAVTERITDAPRWALTTPSTPTAPGYASTTRTASPP
ncbi:hypothetical protein GCM10010400_41360 [Streptomyces aculeolatus]